MNEEAMTRIGPQGHKDENPSLNSGFFSSNCS
jgi:hypothetical protein